MVRGDLDLPQSMTITDTRDVDATVAQIDALEEAGCELARVAVVDDAAAQSLGAIKAATRRRSGSLPLYRLRIEQLSLDRQGVQSLFRLLRPSELRLRELELVRMDSLRDEDVNSLARPFKRLEALSVEGCAQVRFDACRSWPFARLKRLNVSGCPNLIYPEDFARLVDYRMEFQAGARRFDVGEGANFALLPMAVAALEQLLDWGPENVQATLSAMTGEIAARAARLGLTASDPALRAGHFLGLRFPAGVPDGLTERLAAEQVYVSVRGDSMRVTPHLYNDDRDIERLMQVLEAVL